MLEHPLQTCIGWWKGVQDPGVKWILGVLNLGRYQLCRNSTAGQQMMWEYVGLIATHLDDTNYHHRSGFGTLLRRFCTPKMPTLVGCGAIDIPNLWNAYHSGGASHLVYEQVIVHICLCIYNPCISISEYLRKYCAVMWLKQFHKPSPVITIFLGAMFTIPSHGWFMALF